MKTYETSFRHADGRKARVFSSADKSTVDFAFQVDERLRSGWRVCTAFCGLYPWRSEEFSA